MRYVIAVHTGTEKDAGTIHGTVSVSLHGAEGDTDVRALRSSLSQNSSLWRSGQEDVFVVEAVSVGQLEKIQLTYDANGRGRSQSTAHIRL
jgi:hypothetical protein